jgi:hypothetical protein
MTRKTRLWLFVAALLPSVIAAYLYLFSMSSSAYHPAVSAVLESKEVTAYLGESPRTTLLLGVRQNLGTTSCSTLTFYTAGAQRSGFVSILLVESPSTPWAKKEISVGWFAQGQRECSEFQ